MTELRSKLVIDDIFSEKGRKALIEAYTRSMWQANTFQKAMWCGVPILQTPEDMVMIAELIWRTKPDVVIECGVYKGGGLLLYSCLLDLMGGGCVIGMDIDIDPALHVLEHPLGHRISLIEGDTGNPEILEKIKPKLIHETKVMVILDSDHSAAHVKKELGIFAPLIQSGGYLIVLDGVMQILYDIPGIPETWEKDNPETAVKGFLEEHPEFERDLDCNKFGTTFGPGGYLRRF